MTFNYAAFTLDCGAFGDIIVEGSGNCGLVGSSLFIGNAPDDVANNIPRPGHYLSEFAWYVNPVPYIPVPGTYTATLVGESHFPDSAAPVFLTETSSKLLGYSFTGPDINLIDSPKIIGYNYAGTINNVAKPSKILGYMLLSTLPIATPKASTSVRIGTIKGISVP